MSRQPAPDLEPSNPPCSICYLEAEFDGDCFLCPSCNAYWDTDYNFLEWYEPDADQCTHTREMRGELGSPSFSWRCLLALGHPGWHQVGSPELVE